MTKTKATTQSAAPGIVFPSFNYQDALNSMKMINHDEIGGQSALVHRSDPNRHDTAFNLIRNPARSVKTFNMLFSEAMPRTSNTVQSQNIDGPGEACLTGYLCVRTSKMAFKSLSRRFLRVQLFPYPFPHYECMEFGHRRPEAIRTQEAFPRWCSTRAWTKLCRRREGQKGSTAPSPARATSDVR